MSTAEEAQARARAVWSTGDYADIARTIQGVADATVEAVGIQPGDALLDVATGTGNAAVTAARAGARVTGLDITPELLAIARERAAAEGLDIEFEQGDAAALPHEDAGFDRIISVFGAMFAPDQRRTAAELARTCRPGGTIAVTAWTPDGLNGEVFATMVPHLPPPPPGFQPPTLWGVEDHVWDLFEGAGEVRCERRPARGAVQAESVDAWLDFLERTLGPVIVAKGVLEAEGRWAPLRSELAALFERYNEADDGTLRAAPEYLLTVVHRDATATGG